MALRHHYVFAVPGLLVWGGANVMMRPVFDSDVPNAVKLARHKTPCAAPTQRCNIRGQASKAQNNTLY